MEKAQVTDEKTHKLKISIDIRSIKDQQFLGQIFVKYPAIPELNIRAFRNAPTLPITNARVQQQIPNAFCSSYFQATSESISSKMNQTLQVEVWHSDRLKKDALLGVSKVQLSQIMTLALRKTKESYARVFDGYVAVDAVDEERKPQRKIAAVRVIVYLEDLGPVGLLKENQEKFGLRPVGEEELTNVNYRAEENGVGGGGGGVEGAPPGTADVRQLELNELEYKVVWELETWKKAEEAKAKILLKQKEVEFWSQLSEQQKKSDLEKQKHFKKIEANLSLLEGKLRAKSGELQKRQQKLVLLEQQLQAKVAEVSRQLLSKDEQLDQLKKKSKEDKQNLAKEKAALDLEIQRLRNQNAKLRADFEMASKEDEKSPLFIIKTELNSKNLELRELSRECEKALETKEQYRVYYQKMRNQVVRLKAQLDKRQQGSQALRFQNQLLKNNLRNLQQQLSTATLHHHSQQPPYFPAGPPPTSPDQPQFASQLQRLRWQRQHLLDSGVYSLNDPLIKEFDKLIGSN